MTWFTVLASLFVLLALTALVSWLVLYIQFCNTLEKRWRDQVLGLRAAAARRVHSENQQLRQLGHDQDAETRSLRGEAFRSYLDDISVNELKGYPGIGPATLGKLRGEGYVNLATLRNAHIRIHGLGAKRQADIDDAVRDLLWKARSSFDAGACQQARALVDQLDELSAKYDRLEVRAKARARAAEEVINVLQGLVAIARQVTFWRWFRPISEEKLVPPGVMDAALPNLEAAIQSADARAARTGKQHRATPINDRDMATVLPVDPLPAIPVPTNRHAVPHAREPGHVSSSARTPETDMPDNTHLLLMELTIQFFVGVARADGPVTWTERELIRQHVHQRFSYNRALLNRAEAFCTHYETAAIDMERCVTQINERFTTGHRTALMAFAGQIVAVSGKEAARAVPFLHDLAQRLRVPPVALPLPEQPAQPLVPLRDVAVPALHLQSQLERPSQSLVPPKPPISPPPAVKPAVSQRPPAVRVAAAAPPTASRPSSTAPAAPARPPVATSPPPVRPVTPLPKSAAEPTRDQYLALLEIPPGTPLSADLVQRQWNLLSERLAPERVASMGPDFVKLAETKHAALRRAAEILLESMGEKLEIQPPAPPARDPRHNPDLDDVFGGM